MARVILVTGGSRSGKSSFAQNRAQGLPGPRLFVATCPVLDEEMRARINRHKALRTGQGWDTIEEEIDLPRTIREAQTHPTLLVDCLTLWVNNLMYRAEQSHQEMTESHMESRCLEVLAACLEHPGTVIFVTNEVGWGIVPANALARRYRDLAGRCNQTIAAGADEVVLVVCGIATYLKKGT